jgi:threonine/homoserine/homoserine lactone efflux protein
MPMSAGLLLRGLAIGFSIAAPVGPIGVLCIRRTLERGWRSGLLTGLGAASADALYGAVAGFGLTAVSNALVEQRTWLGLLGGVFLCCLGIRTLLAGPRGDDPQARPVAAGDWASTFALTLTNPMTILSFAGIYAGLGVGTAGGDYADAGLVVVGVFLGSLLWWVILSAAVARLRGHIGDRARLWINRASGAIILGFGVAALVAAAF